MTDTTTNIPGGWHPDPFARHELRWWDGQRWTEHVSTGGVAAVDAPAPTPAPGLGTGTPEEVRHQVQNQAGAVAAFAGGGHLLTEPVLVVNQKAKLIELTNEYAVYDQHGRQLGAVREVGQSTARKAVRALTRFDQYLSKKLEVVDASGAVVLRLAQPAKLVKAKIDVTDGAGNLHGRILQQNMIGKVRFGLESGQGVAVGSINAENWRAWNFRIEDHTGTEVARITKTWEGIAKAMFTTADNYVIQLHRPLQDPLRALVVASAVSVDTALKQNE